MKRQRGRPRTTSLKPKSLRWRLFHSAKFRAKKRGILFDLRGENIPQVPRRCPILDIVIRPGKGKATPNSPSLDRIIPELGYTVGNVQIISNRANTLKSNSTRDELLALATWALKHMPS
jgi:hypothetical protein